ncbi:MAG: hypothetical protein ACYCT7_08455 [bacterium]
MDASIYEEMIEIVRIGKIAVRKAQETNLKAGIPNVYSKDGKLYFEMPDGEITSQNPFDIDLNNNSNNKYV